MKRNLTITAALFANCHNALALEWSAIYGHQPAPFKLSVNPEIIALAHQKASLTRFSVDVEQPDWSDGPPVHNATSVRDYWVNEYDWFKVQREINSQYAYTQIIHLWRSYFICILTTEFKGFKCLPRQLTPNHILATKSRFLCTLCIIVLTAQMLFLYYLSTDGRDLFLKFRTY